VLKYLFDLVEFFNAASAAFWLTPLASNIRLKSPPVIFWISSA
jgi:hypothetical protein